MGWVGCNVVVEGGKIPTIPPSKESSKRAAMTWRMLIVEQVATIVSMDSSTLEAQVLEARLQGRWRKKEKGYEVNERKMAVWKLPPPIRVKVTYQMTDHIII